MAHTQKEFGGPPIGPAGNEYCIPSEDHWLEEHSHCLVQLVSTKKMTWCRFKGFWLASGSVHSLDYAIPHTFIA